MPIDQTVPTTGNYRSADSSHGSSDRLEVSGDDAGNRLAQAFTDWRAAFRSSASKSGISSRICSALRPAENRSKTSDTRILMPRMQGRPQHWLGLMVMRSSRSSIVIVLRLLED